MSQKINVPGLGVIEFPDGMSKHDMGQAIQRKLASTPDEPAPQEPVEQAGALGSFGLGAQRSAGRLWSGAQDIYNLGAQYGAGEAGVPVSEYRQAREKIEADEAAAESAYEAKTGEHPLARFLGEAAPYAAAPLGGGPARAAMIGAGLGGERDHDNRCAHVQAI